MKKRFKEWEQTVMEIVDRGPEYIATFIIMDICIMLMATGICSIVGTVIGFILGMAPYWSEMLLGWFVTYMALFFCMMDVCKFDLDAIKKTEELKKMILELQKDDDEEENEG